jgi:hypothetical protein
MLFEAISFVVDLSSTRGSGAEGCDSKVKTQKSQEIIKKGLTCTPPKIAHFVSLEKVVLPQSDQLKSLKR